VKLSPNAPCPCGSTKKAKRCCGPLLDGQAAPSPEALMRSRYVAYSLGDVAYVQRTTHSQSPHREANLTAWTARLREFCEQTRFLGLRVLSAETTGEQGVVRFWVSLQRGADDVSFGEESRFVREGGRWVYLAGRPSPRPAGDGT
jgi:SEC-C motif domain protein